MGDGLLALSRAEYHLAKRRLDRRFWAHGATFGFGVAALFLDPPVVFVLAVAAVVSEGAAWWLRFTGMGGHELAERGTRRARLIAGLGTDPDPTGTADLRATYGPKTRALAPAWEDPDYFASSEPPGQPRLCEMLQESAFWSSHLFRKSSDAIFITFAGAVLLIAVLILALFTADSGPAAEATARVATVLLATLIAADLLGVALAQRSAAAMSSTVVARLDSCDGSDPARLLIVYGDYVAATAATPPIPDRVWRTHRDALDAEWRNRGSGT